MPNETQNKVLFNLKNVHIAPITGFTNGVPSYDTIFAWPGAVSLALDPQGESYIFYADGKPYFRVTKNNGYSGDFQSALVPETFNEKILGVEKDSNGVRLEKALTEDKHFAMLYEIDGDQKSRRVCDYDCTATRPKVEHKTNEEGVEVQVHTSTITSTPVDFGNGNVLPRAWCEQGDAAYAGWFENVYVPGTTIESSTSNDEDPE